MLLTVFCIFGFHTCFHVQVSLCEMRIAQLALYNRGIRQYNNYVTAELLTAMPPKRIEEFTDVSFYGCEFF